MFNRKLGLQRLRSMANLPGGLVVCEVFSQLHAIGLELERMHPKLYSGVAKQVKCVLPPSWSPLTSRSCSTVVRSLSLFLSRCR